MNAAIQAAPKASAISPRAVCQPLLKVCLPSRLVRPAHQHQRLPDSSRIYQEALLERSDSLLAFWRLQIVFETSADWLWSLCAQICHEFERFSTYMSNVKVGNFFGGLPIKQHKKVLKEDCPSIIVGTPGRLKQVG